jgi:hypothetical protein
MYPSINVTTSDSPEAVIYQICSADLMEAEEIYDKAKRKPGTMGIRLICAYIHVTGESPVNLAQVKAWAKEKEVWAEDAETPDPTQPDQSGDSSPN